MTPQHSRRKVFFWLGAAAASAACSAESPTPVAQTKAAAKQKTNALTVRRANERGHADHGWLNTYHTFSFASYQDPAHMGFRNLRVINEDRVQPGRGFGTHPHQNMEIISYVLEGGLEHKDSMGTGSVILPGEVQRMSAGTGITHSEFNASKQEFVHFLQIWLLPAKNGIKPEYEQKAIAPKENHGGIQLVASPDGANGSVTIHTDARLFAGRFFAGQTSEVLLKKQRHAWVHIARGSAQINGVELFAGDGASLSNEQLVAIESTKDCEVLVFDLALTPPAK